MSLLNLKKVGKLRNFMNDSEIVTLKDQCGCTNTSYYVYTLKCECGKDVKLYICSNCRCVHT